MLFRAGTSAVVLSAPHGGTLTPDAVPDRPSGCFELDTHTAQLALAVPLASMAWSQALARAPAEVSHAMCADGISLVCFHVACIQLWSTSYR